MKRALLTIGEEITTQTILDQRPSSALGGRLLQHNCGSNVFPHNNVGHTQPFQRPGGGSVVAGQRQRGQRGCSGGGQEREQCRIPQGAGRVLARYVSLMWWENLPNISGTAAEQGQRGGGRLAKQLQPLGRVADTIRLLEIIGDGCVGSAARLRDSVQCQHEQQRTTRTKDDCDEAGIHSHGVHEQLLGHHGTGLHGQAT